MQPIYFMCFCDLKFNSAGLSNRGKRVFLRFRKLIIVVGFISRDGHAKVKAKALRIFLQNPVILHIESHSKII